jgi:MFS family permease
MPADGRPSPFAHAAFRWYAACLVCATLAIQIRSTVVAWQVYDLTGSYLALGLIGVAEIIPFLCCILPAGALADRSDRVGVMRGALALHLLCAGGLLALALLPGLPWMAGGLLGAVALGALARALLMPARTALSAEVAPREMAEQVARWRTGLFQIALVAGPALGGLIYAAGGAVAAYAVDSALIALAAGCLLGIPATRPQTVARSGAGGIGEGVRFLLGERVLLGASALDLFAVLFGGAVAMLPAFAKEVLHVGPQGLGVLRAAPAVGAAGLALFLAWRPPFAHAGRTMLLAVAVFGLCMIGFGLSTAFWLSLALLAVSGAADQISVVVRGQIAAVVRLSLLQVRTPPHLLGRVSSVNAIFIGSSNEVGALESGVAARLLGLVPSVVAGGAITLAVVGATAWLVPGLRRLERIQKPV